MTHQQHSQSPQQALPNLHTLSISPYPAQIPGDYRYNGVFGPPAIGGISAGAWSPTNRGSRSGIPTNWYDPPSRDSLTAPFEPYRRDAASPPALSPPSSTTSAPNTASALPYAHYHQPTAFAANSYTPMALTPSPPPQLGYGMPTAGSAPNLAGYNPAGLPQYGSQSLASLQPARNGVWGVRNGYVDEDVIPTAIVIKNIPFAVAREQLLGVIESLGAPLPYAFNYHHDNGIFRGLAFANFRAPDEAASVVAALNGYDVQGRKLRVEYKKVLQPGEKDKIEREKALKRMRSIQFDSPAVRDMPQGIPSLPIGSNRPGSATNGSLSADIDQSPPHSASSATSDNLPVSLDLNDPTALDIYSRVLVFKEDRMRDELAFSKSLTPIERRIVHLVAQKLGLISITKGDEGEVKYVVVTRESLPRPTLTASTSATISSSYLSPYGQTQIDVSPSLRIKKSMPDLRGFNGPVVARDPAKSLTPQRSSGNLRGDNGSREYVSMGAVGGRRANGVGSGTFNSFFGAPIDGIPPVPPLPAGLARNSVPANGMPLSPSSGSPPEDSVNAAPMRNPRGPAGDNRGFGGGLRNSASGMLRGPGTGPGLGIGRRVSEEDEGEEEPESLRMRESLEL